MRLPPKLKILCIYFISIFLTNIPQLVSAQTMISTHSIVAELSQAEAQAQVDNFLKRDDVQKQLMTYGVSAEEAALRVATLSKAEMNQLVLQMNEARAGGDILYVILVVVLIIFLVKRI